MIRSAYARGERVSIGASDDGRTRQSMADECDIHLILKGYAQTGRVEHLAQLEPQFGFVPALTLQEAFEVTAKAEKLFGEIPSELRKRFDHSPVEFLKFVQNPENADELVKLGLREVPEAPPRTVAEEVAEGIKAAAAAAADGGSGGAPAD